MADNITVKDGSGSDVTIASDDIGGVQYSRHKMVWGADGASNDTSAANPLPVSPNGSVASGSADTGNPIKMGGVYNASLPTLDDGDRGNIQLNSSGAQLVDLQTRLDQTNDSVTSHQGGTWNIGTVTGVTTVSTVSSVTNVATISGSDVAHDAADSNNPQKIGCKATSSLSGLTLVSDADRTNVFAGIDGVIITRPHTNLEDIVSGVVAITDGSSTSVIASAGAGVKIYITDVIICNTSATEVTVDLKDGAAGSVKATCPVPANNGGFTRTFGVPLPFSAATAVCADPSAAASTITVTLIGFKSKI